MVFPCSIFVSLFLSLSLGCSSPRTYAGVVVDARTNAPLARATVSGACYEPGAFRPTPDGLRERAFKCVRTVTDSRGRFGIELRGKGRTLRVIPDVTTDPDTGQRVSYKPRDIVLKGVRASEMITEVERE